MTKRDLALDLFKSYKTGFINKKKPIEQRTTTASDPQLIGSVLTNLVEERDWHLGIAEGTLFTTWKDVVGQDIAAHTTPLSLLDGALLIQCSSTAWATQLKAVGQDLLLTIQKAHPAPLLPLWLLSVLKPLPGNAGSVQSVTVEALETPTAKPTTLVLKLKKLLR